jgi:hypothetical protein
MQQELKSPNSKLDLWQIRELNRKTRLPQTLVVFKVFSGKTPKIFAECYLGLMAMDCSLISFQFKLGSIMTIAVMT